MDSEGVNEGTSSAVVVGTSHGTYSLQHWRYPHAKQQEDFLGASASCLAEGPWGTNFQACQASCSENY